jgi:hypothetical protein
MNSPTYAETFAASFPTLTDFHIAVRFLAPGFMPPGVDTDDRLYRPGSPPPFVVPCPNPRCRTGGFDTTGVLSALANGQREATCSMRCEGQEGSAGGRHGVPRCYMSAEIHGTAGSGAGQAAVPLTG